MTLVVKQDIVPNLVNIGLFSLGAEMLETDDLADLIEETKGLGLRLLLQDNYSYCEIGL